MFLFITETIDLFTDTDVILNFRPVYFCVKRTLYFVSTSNIMEEFQFSRSFDLRMLYNMSVEVYVFIKVSTVKKFSYTLWRVKILQHWRKP